VVDTSFGERCRHGCRGFVAVQEDSEALSAELAVLFDRGANFVYCGMVVDPGDDAEPPIGQCFGQRRVSEVPLSHSFGNRGQQLSRIPV
jgi:hypothetical protein